MAGIIPVYCAKIVKNMNKWTEDARRKTGVRRLIPITDY